MYFLSVNDFLANKMNISLWMAHITYTILNISSFYAITMLYGHFRFLSPSSNVPVYVRSKFTLQHWVMIMSEERKKYSKERKLAYFAIIIILSLKIQHVAPQTMISQCQQETRANYLIIV